MSSSAPFPLPLPGPQSAKASETLLCIDLGATATGISRTEAGLISSVALDALTAGLLAETMPDRVICALFGARQDAFAVIESLQMLGFAGEITVLCPKLPNPRLVETELRALGPGRRLTLLQMG